MQQHVIERAAHNVGIAVDSPNGLVVPNIKHVEQVQVYLYVCVSVCMNVCVYMCIHIVCLCNSLNCALSHSPSRISFFSLSFSLSAHTHMA